MNYAVYNYVESALARFPAITGNVLEIGSYDVNGSVRPLFQDQDRFPAYVGIDMRSGPGVDRVMVASEMAWEDAFDIVVCTEMLEHDSRFWHTANRIKVALRNSGHLILTTRNVGYERHDYPSDYWRFTSDGLRELFNWTGLQEIEVIDDNQTKMAAGIWKKSQ